MRRIWRLFHVFIITLGYTAYVSLMLRFRPEEERPIIRARRQQVGTGLLCRALGVRTSLRGTPPAGKAMLYVSNHIGLLDPLVVGSLIPVSIVGKAELASWPFVGWVCRTYGLLFVERGRRTATSDFVRQVQEKLGEGVSVLVFPEGTTNWGDVVQPFKTGAFEAVAGRDEAVLPLYVDVTAVNGEPTGDGRLLDVTHNGRTFTEHCWHLLGLKRVDMAVWVGEPVAAAGRNRKELARLTHQFVNRLAGRSPVET
jgi:1-acyl-sn-glycerol-3-phosphate acyltransferase